MRYFNQFGNVIIIFDYIFDQFIQLNDYKDKVNYLSLILKKLNY